MCKKKSVLRLLPKFLCRFENILVSVLIKFRQITCYQFFLPYIFVLFHLQVTWIFYNWRSATVNPSRAHFFIVVIFFYYYFVLPLPSPTPPPITPPSRSSCSHALLALLLLLLLRSSCASPPPTLLLPPRSSALTLLLLSRSSHVSVCLLVGWLVG